MKVPTTISSTPPSGKSCSSEVSIYDGIAGSESDNLLRKICGPVAREPRDSSGRFIQPEFLISSGNILEIHLNLGPHTDVEKQFLVGAYQFHNSRLEGTKNPNSVCDVMFYGADSPSRGTVQDPPTRLLWNVEGSLTCSYLFVPTSNQSLSIMVRDAGGSLTSASCTTICGEEGCQCRPSMLPLSQVDYLLFVQTKTQKIVACLCGDMQGMQGVTVSSSGGIDVTYHVAHFTWATPGFNFTLEYSFPPPTACGPSFYNSPKGELGPREYKVPNTEYLYVTCSWLITNQPGTDLLLSVIPPRQGSCNVWNLTVVGVSRESGQRVVGGVCGADPSKSFRIHQYHHEAASITLELRGRGSREWEVSWNTILPDTHYGDAPTSVSPKPEHSRTLHAEPTGRKTYTVKSQGVSSHRPRWREWRHCGLPLLLTLVLSQTLCF
ncbi:uncharacterized protein LOC135224263 [Macrobrachium nipponense]|uniref:uncharacterized protein LOC135224263 n=1 Tax=Macrobrachium nipponense TaxID=159736 RepID=UPI0030C8949C